MSMTVMLTDQEARMVVAALEACCIAPEYDDDGRLCEPDWVVCRRTYAEAVVAKIEMASLIP